MNLLLIEKSLDIISNYTTHNTECIIFEIGQTYDSLISVLTEQNYDNIGIFSHGNNFSFEFIKTIIADSENTQFIDFLTELKTKTHFKNLDLFSCYFGNNNDFINNLESGLSINVRASTDYTGNTPFGNWIMETDNINIKNIYFNDDISSFNQVLFIPKKIWYWNHIHNEVSDTSKYIISSNGGAFAAIKTDGSVFAWGNSSYGGEVPLSVSSKLTSGVVKIYSNGGAFAALKDNGSVVTWGDSGAGGHPPDLPTTVASGVVKIYSNNLAFAALKDNGSVVTWGNFFYGGNSSVVTPEGNSSVVRSDLTSGVVKIYSNNRSFAALKDNGSVVTWGYSTYGGNSSFVTPEGNSSSVSSDLASGVVKIYSNGGAFAALKDDGSVVTWGASGSGGDSSNVSSDLASGVVRIYSNIGAFAALKDDGSVVTWGFPYEGGEVPSSVSSYLASGVVYIYPSSQKFAALKDDGSVVMWGEETAVVHSNLVNASNYYDLYHLTPNQLTDSSLLDDFPEFELVVFSQSSSSSGDPYVTTLCGNKFKLPNANKTYRMVQFTDSKNKDLIVNASVSQLTTDEIEQLENIAMSFTNSKPVTNGYFYENFYISYGSKYAVFDRHINLIDTNIIDNDDIQKEGITIKYETESKPFSCPIQGNSTSLDTIITVGNSIIRLQKINHPQIINGINFSTPNKNTDMVKGILNTYYHPKNYSIKKIDSTKQISNSNKKLYKKNIVEKWINV